jgi:carbon storage regulator CsrA
MLVLSRKVGERVVISDRILVQVLEAKSLRVRLGIEARADVAVWREELSAAGEPVSPRRGMVRKPR